MAISILWIDGFDEIGNINQKYKAAPEANPQSSGTYTSRSNTTPPFAYGRFTAVYNGYLSRTLPSPPYTVLFSAFHMWAGYILDNVSNRQIRFEFWNDTENAAQCYVTLEYNYNRGLFDAVLVRGTTDVYTWQTGIQYNSWYHISLRAFIDDVLGSVTLAVDGADLGTYTGDTRALVSSGADRFRLRYTVNDDRCFFVDDWIIATGLITDGLLPTARVYGALVPVANVAVSWTPSSGANWQCVDEIPHNSDSDYNWTGTVGNRDVFSHAAISNTGTNVLAVKVNSISRKDGAPVESIQPLVRVSSTDYYGTAQEETTSYFSYGHIWQNNPATGLPWTPADAQAAGFGYRRQ